jgi:hypothetical protein
MYCLELYSGTKSIGQAFERLGWTVHSLDIDASNNPTFCWDIRDFPFESIPRGFYSFVHASPPCTHFSRARTTGGPRDLETADSFVLKALQIIEYVAPTFWCLENPETGLLKTRSYMEGIPYRDVTYCSYGTSFKKSTRLWGMLPESFVPKYCQRDCDAWDGRKHMSTAQRAEHSLRTLYQIPRRLCDDIAQSVTRALTHA